MQAEKALISTSLLMAPKRTYELLAALLETISSDLNTNKVNGYKILDLLGLFWLRKSRAEVPGPHGRFSLFAVCSACWVVKAEPRSFLKRYGPTIQQSNPVSGPYRQRTGARKHQIQPIVSLVKFQTAPHGFCRPVGEIRILRPVFGP